MLGKFYEDYGKIGEQFSIDLQNMQARHGISQEEAIIDGEILNVNGMDVNGKWIGGIKQATDEIMEELGIYRSKSFAGNRSTNGGILGVLETQKSYAEGLIPYWQTGKDERQKRFLKMKAAFKANVALRKAQAKKLKKMSGAGLSWKEGISHNNDIIEKWRHWIRDSDEGPDARRHANHEIDRLGEENKWLREHKPKPLSTGTPQYTKMLASYNQRGYENLRLVGNRDETKWGNFTPESAAGRMQDSYSFFKESLSFFQGELTPLTNSIESTKTDISKLEADYKDWTGQKAPDTSQKALTEMLADIGRNFLAWQRSNNNQASALEEMQPLVNARMVGAFAHGGLIPDTGMALVHKGEFVVPSPDGPYRNGMNAPAKYEPNLTVELVLKDRAGSMVELVDARINKRAANVVSQQTGAKSRILRVAPGG
jgi:hypothetical protein